VLKAILHLTEVGQIVYLSTLYLSQVGKVLQVVLYLS